MSPLILKKLCKPPLRLDEEHAHGVLSLGIHEKGAVVSSGSHSPRDDSTRRLLCAALLRVIMPASARLSSLFYFLNLNYHFDKEVLRAFHVIQLGYSLRLLGTY